MISTPVPTPIPTPACHLVTACLGRRYRHVLGRIRPTQYGPTLRDHYAHCRPGCYVLTHTRIVALGFCHQTRGVRQCRARCPAVFRDDLPRYPDAIRGDSRTLLLAPCQHRASNLRQHHPVRASTRYAEALRDRYAGVCGRRVPRFPSGVPRMSSVCSPFGNPRESSRVLVERRRPPFTAETADEHETSLPPSTVGLGRVELEKYELEARTQGTGDPQTLPGGGSAIEPGGSPQRRSTTRLR